MTPDLELLKDAQRVLRLQRERYGHEPEAENVRFRVIARMAELASRTAVVVALVVPASAQEHRHHPAADMPLHEKFYGTWMMPDNPAKSCCNKADCYPTEVRWKNGHWQAKRREDGKWLWIPHVKVEQHRDNPDGRNHLCAPPPGASYPPDTVFCFTLGTGI